MSKFLVIIPTHKHFSTLPFSIKSVLNQSLSDFNLTVIGDGVCEEIREVIREVKDSRINFIDSPKTKVVGETLRHKVINSSNCEYITYLGDDDLFLSNHLEVMSEELKYFDFVNPLPVLIRKNIQIFDKNISLEKDVLWHLDKQCHNSISLTGASHTFNIYKKLPFGWRETLKGRWTDHYMWEQFFNLKDIKLNTSKYSTTLKLIINKLSNKDIEVEIKKWYNKTLKIEFFDEWQKQLAMMTKENNAQQKDKNKKKFLRVRKSSKFFRVGASGSFCEGRS